MLRRVSLLPKDVPEFELTPEEVEEWAYHITVYEKERPVNVDLLRGIYNKLPDEFKYQGPIYRGVHIEPEEVINLAKNKPFTTDDRSKKITVESWSRKEHMARSFAVWGDVIEIVGLVLASDTSEHEVVMEYTPQIANFVLRWVQDRKLDLSKPRMDKSIRMNIYGMDGFKTMHEVGVVNKGAGKYRLCDDVITVMVRNDFWSLYEEEAQALAVIVSEEGQEEVEYMREVLMNESPESAEEWTAFQCDGDGKLTMGVSSTEW